MIKVTVYILTYKRFDSIYRTIDSLLCQDYGNIELFVSDDGSPNFPCDDIVAYIEANKRENICSYKVLDNKVNYGTVKHINNILKQASGDLYIPLAGDDQFFDETVISRIVDRYHKEHFKVLSTSRAMYKHEGLYEMLMPHYDSRDVIVKTMATARQQLKAFTECKMMNFASGSAMTYEASFLKEVGLFDEKYRLWEDGPFINKMTTLGYPLSFAYDIVSIKYQWGGVSVGHNPIMDKDIDIYNSTDLWNNSEKYGWYHRRILKYSRLKYKDFPVLKRLAVKLIYSDVVIDQILYQLAEYFRSKTDIKYLNGIK